MNAIRVACATLLVLCSWAAPSEARASAVVVACGDTITADLVLTHDLVNCPTVGLVVGADDVTIDLNGHTIDGEEGSAEFGIDATGGHSGLTVLGGTIQQFVEGVLVVGGSGHHVHHLRTADEQHVGVYIAESTDVRVNRVRSIDSCAGVVVENSGHVRVDHNTVLGHSCGAIAIYESYRVRIALNEIDAAPDRRVRGDSAGISVLAGSHSILVRANVVAGNGFVGVHLGNVDWSRVIDNRVVRNAIGMILIGDRNVLRGNRIARTALGCRINPGDGSCGTGISYEGGSDNVIEGNIVTRAGKAGISLATFAPETPPALRTGVFGNVVRLARVDGIRVAPGVRGTHLEQNLTAASGGDGIDVNDARTTLGANRAFRNGDLGIEGTRGNDDIGANRARDNGDPRQCTFVRCR